MLATRVLVMIIWQRWGILVFVAIGVSIGLGFLLKAVLGLGGVDDNTLNGVFVGIGFLMGAGLLWLFTALALPKLDRPRPLVQWQQLAAPETDEQGRTRTHRPVPVVNSETGQQVWSTPRSTFFFVPMRFWVILLAAGGLLILAINLVALLTR